MYVKKIVFGMLIAGSMFAGCGKTKKKTVTVTDPKQAEEISQLKKERDELTQKLQLASDPKMKEKLEKMASDLASRDAQIKEKDTLIAAKEKELEEAKKGSSAEEVARLQKELDTLRGEKVTMEAEHKAALAGKQALIDAAERDKARLEKVLDFSFQKDIQNRDELDSALNQGVAEAEGRVAVLVDDRADLKADIAAGYERILELQKKYVHPVEDMLADKKALESLESRTEQEEEKLQNLIDYFTASEKVDTKTKTRLNLAADRDKLEEQRDALAAQLTAASQEEANLLEQIVKLSETEGTQPSDKMQDLIARRNAKLTEIADLKSKKTTNATALEQNAKDTDTIDGEIAALKETMDVAYDKYQTDTVAPSREELKKAEAEQSRLLTSYKENGKDLENAKTALAEIKDLRDFIARKPKSEPQAG